MLARWLLFIAGALLLASCVAPRPSVLLEPPVTAPAMEAWADAAVQDGVATEVVVVTDEPEPTVGPSASAVTTEITSEPAQGQPLPSQRSRAGPGPLPLGSAQGRPEVEGTPVMAATPTAVPSLLERAVGAVTSLVPRLPLPIPPPAPAPVPPAAPAATIARVVTSASGPPTITTAQMLANAERLLGVPYVWGGNSEAGMDCSAYVSRAWGVGRHTTDSIGNVSFPITKAELLTGDALNLTTWADPRGYGHIRMFDRWADEQMTAVWVYEETSSAGGSVHRRIRYDDRYQPIRRLNYQPEGRAPLVSAEPAPVDADDSARRRDGDPRRLEDDPRQPREVRRDPAAAATSVPPREERLRGERSAEPTPEPAERPRRPRREDVEATAVATPVQDESVSPTAAPTRATRREEPTAVATRVREAREPTPRPTRRAVEPTAIATRSAPEPRAVPAEPTAVPTRERRSEPTAVPTRERRSEPTAVPTRERRSEPTAVPTRERRAEPTAVPTREQRAEPTAVATRERREAAPRATRAPSRPERPVRGEREAPRPARGR